MLRRIFKNLYFLTFLNGFMLATLFYFKMEASYENTVFRLIKDDIDEAVKTTDNQDSVVVKVMASCHNLMNSRTSVFQYRDLGGFKADFVHPATIDLMTANGACGSFSLVLARILENYNFPIRIAQMQVNGVYGAHNIVEVKTNQGWVVLDPLFNVYFTKPGGQGLASFDDVQNNWNFYQKQVPADYNMKYNYSGVRYTNWEKLPILLPAVKKTLDYVIGKANADKFSIRVYFLKMYDVYFYSILFLYLPLLLFSIKQIIKTKVFPQPNIPFTITNVKFYIRHRFFGKEFKSA